MDEELEEARMDLAFAARQIEQLAGADALIEDLLALIHLIQQQSTVN